MHKMYDPKLREWSGPLDHGVLNPSATLGKILLYGLNKRPEKVSHIYPDENKQVTYAEVKLQSIRVALNLKKLGLKQGDVVSLIGSNGSQLTPLLIGCALSNIVTNLVDVNVENGPLEQILGVTKPTLVICCEKMVPLVTETLKDLKVSAQILSIDTGVEVLFEPVEQEENFVPDHVADPANITVFLSCTSGTTAGNKKAAMISQSQTVTHTQHFLSIEQDDIVFINCASNWITIPTGIFDAIFNAATVVLTAKPFCPEHQAKIIETYRVTNIFTIPLHTIKFVEYMKSHEVNVSSLKRYYLGGTKVYDSLKRSIEATFPNCRAITAYGLTEAFMLTNEFREQRSESVGQPIPLVKIKVVDENNKRLLPNETGEICCKQLYPFLGYYGEPEKTEEVFDSEGWLHTGDIGHFDDDSFLFIEGRAKDVIKCKGANYNASTVEQFLTEKLKLMETCVVGIYNEEMGYELPAAAIVKPENCTLTEEDISRVVAKNLPPSRHFDGGVYFVPELPYTSSGKLKRYEVALMIQKLYQEVA